MPVGSDGRTVLMTEDGARMSTVSEWFTEDRKGREGASTRPQPPHPTLSPRGGPSGRAQLPPRNPFRKKFWNLTEEMRLQKNDPEFAAKLKAEAWAEE